MPEWIWIILIIALSSPTVWAVEAWFNYTDSIAWRNLRKTLFGKTLVFSSHAAWFLLWLLIFVRVMEWLGVTPPP